MESNTICIERNKFLFSGSWMEKIDDLSDLMASIEQTNSSETALKIFNILIPYDKPLPEIDEEELVIKDFYDVNGDKFNPVGDLKKTTPHAYKEKLAARGIDNLMSEGERKETIRKYRESKIDEDLSADEMIENQEIIDLKGLLATTNQKLEDAIKERDELKALIEEKDEFIDELKEQTNANATNEGKLGEENYELKEKAKNLEDELTATQNQLNDLKLQLKKNSQEYEKLVADIPEIKELEAIRKAMETNEKQRQLDNQRDKALRFRSGQIFQKGI